MMTLSSSIFLGSGARYSVKREEWPIKLWIDDLRPAPKGYAHTYDIEQAIKVIRSQEEIRDTAWLHYLSGRYTRQQLDWWLQYTEIEVISCDNDLGPRQAEGYKLLDWLEATGRSYPIHIHTDNPVARERMRAIIERNGWTEVK